MSLSLVGLSGVLLLLLLLVLVRIPVGFAMALIGFAGFWTATSREAALGMLGYQAWDVFSSYGLTVIPLFILMGQICYHSGVNQRLYKATDAWLGRLPGGLSIATILACAGFSAICGSNTATAATMSTVALPEMKKYDYHPMLSTGCVAAGATLGVLIPPSVVLIIIGLQTGQSIADLFTAALFPGLLLTLLFMITVVVICLRRPHFGPTGAPCSLRRKLRTLPGALEALLLFMLVVGGLSLGVFTPSEAGAVGSGLALLMSVVSGNFTWTRYFRAVNDTLRVSCMILVIIYGAVVFGRFLAITRLPYVVAETVAGLPLPPMLIVACICLVYAIGGAVMDALALLIITIPIFFPVADSLGYDPIWFSALITVVTTMGAITPPVGVNTYIVASMAKDVPQSQVFKGVALFLPAYAVCIAVLLLFPDLPLWLVRVLK